MFRQRYAAAAVKVTEGATVYLRVSNPGALLYFGDGHAAQGDGELNGNALETSMDVDLTADAIRAFAASYCWRHTRSCSSPS